MNILRSTCKGACGIKKYVLVTALSLFVSSGIVAAQTVASCDGNIGNNSITCASSPTTPDNQIDGDLGDDNIIQNAGVTTSYIDADGAATGGDVAGVGNGGKDIIVNNGIITISISGDYVTGIPGHDTITNNGTAGAILGDETQNASLQNGNDIIVNNGTITNYIEGDGSDGMSLGGGNGGNDTIINSGSVGGSIFGDSGAGVGGSDKITNNGSVSGSIDARGGNDTVIIGTRATVGGTIDGGTGTDTLQFNFANPTTQAAAAAAIAGQPPTGGTATFGGHSYTWQNFEAIILFDVSATSSVPLRNYFTISTPTLSWNRVTWAANYDIQVNNTLDFSGSPEFTASVPADQLSKQTSPLANGPYYWRVRACPNSGPCGNWSVPDSFVIAS